uniref:Uncharacterized protein n=1 Tax=Mimivirus LCMiAC01 TaxID=2506608 RepID=A0A481YZ03_9VIRU|nr:MAG: hypothetical protein LCMiAC01_01600 [Mimivirus LCMiAC01]
MTSLDNTYSHEYYEKMGHIDNVNGGLYNTIQNMDGVTIFKYIAIIIASYLFFKNRNINLNIILALVAALVIIYYIHDKKKVDLNNKETEIKTKIDNIVPVPDKIRYHDDIIDFLFSIQDMYEYNPQAYEEMSDNIEAFLTVYDIIHAGTPLCDHYYQIAESKKDNALNSLHSIIYKIPGDNVVVEKHTRAHKRLETILNKYLNKLYDECQHNIVKYGRTVYNRAINLGPKEHNHYQDKDFSYQFY